LLALECNRIDRAEAHLQHPATAKQNALEASLTQLRSLPGVTSAKVDVVAVTGCLKETAPNTWTLTQAVCSKSIVGTVSGIQNFGGNVGGIIAPALTGYIAHVTKSFILALSITGAISVVGILSYLFLISNRVDQDA
jgi:ACS family glucarate transporter-like MFS transporter